MRRTMRFVAGALVIAVAGVAAACGDSDDDDSTSAASSAPAATSAPATSEAAPTSEAATTSAEETTAAERADHRTRPSPRPRSRRPPRSGPAPNYDWGNTRNVQGSNISSENVSELAEAWTVPITGAGTFGNYASTPIVLDGVVFTQDLTSNVKAIDLESGEVLWEKKYDSPSTGPNGVAVADGRVYGATQDSAFALDAASGDELWKVKLTRNKKEGIDMAPGVNGDLVYVSTVPGNPDGFYTGNGQGVVHALNAETGEKAWQFDTVPEDLWGNKEVNSGGGLWHPPAFDDQGAMYFDVANPAPFLGTKELPWATSRPGNNEHTNSLVKLDAATGEEKWKNQVLPHDLYDWDLHLLAGPRRHRRTASSSSSPAARWATSTPSTARAASSLWKTAVGKHNGHDEDNELGPGRQAGPAAEAAADPAARHPRRRRDADGGRGRHRLRARSSTCRRSSSRRPSYELKLDQGTGGMEALDLATGEVKWKHAVRTRRPTARRRSSTTSCSRPRSTARSRRSSTETRRRGVERAAAGRHQRHGGRGGRLADHRGELPAGRRPEAGHHRLQPRRRR